MRPHDDLIATFAAEAKLPPALIAEPFKWPEGMAEPEHAPCRRCRHVPAIIGLQFAEGLVLSLCTNCVLKIGKMIAAFTPPIGGTA